MPQSGLRCRMPGEIPRIAKSRCHNRACPRHGESDKTDDEAPTAAGFSAQFPGVRAAVGVNGWMTGPLWLGSEIHNIVHAMLA